MRKIRITSMTSIIGTRLISRCSFSRPRWKFTRRASGVLGALAGHDVDQLRRLLLHVDDEAVDLVPEVAVEDERRNRDADAERGVVEGDGDAVRQLLRVGAAGRRLRAE